MALYNNGNPVSGLNSIPRLTLAQYNALSVKPEFWVRTDAPESYKKLSADQVSYDSNNTVKDKIDDLSTTESISIQFTNSKCNPAYPIICKRNGNVVNISTILQATTAISQNEILATLPEGYRPSDNFAYFTATSDVVVQATTNGELKIADLSAQVPTSFYFGINITFVI